MGKIFLGTMLTVCAVLCIGYIIHRKNEGKENGNNQNVKDVLKLQDIFDWIDVATRDIAKNDDTKLEVNILPNDASQELTKSNDKRVYVALIKDGEKVLKTKTFFAKSVDVDLESLKKGNIVVIPIK